MSSEPESLVLQILRDMRAERGDMRTDLKADIQSLRADVASDLLAAEAKATAEHKQTREQIVGLRRAVIEYHTTFAAHEIDARCRWGLFRLASIARRRAG